MCLAHIQPGYGNPIIYLRLFNYAVIVMSMCIHPQGLQTLENVIVAITNPTPSRKTGRYYISALRHSISTLGNLNLVNPIKNCPSPLLILIEIIHTAQRYESYTSTLRDLLLDIITPFILLIFTNWINLILSTTYAYLNRDYLSLVSASSCPSLNNFPSSNYLLS